MVPLQPAGQICYPSGVCFEAVSNIAGSPGYQYMSSYSNVPTRWIDTQNPGPGLSIVSPVSANYTLKDFNVSATCGSGGRYMYISPRAVAGMERVNQILGARLSINSGFRSPDCNSRVGGASASYHMSGLAIDMQPGGFSRAEVVQACKDAGSNFQQTYTTTSHVHCDWR